MTTSQYPPTTEPQPNASTGIHQSILRLSRVLGTVTLLLFSSLHAYSQSSQGTALLMQTAAALNGAMGVQDITLSANAQWTSGSDQMSGPAVLKAKGTFESRFDLQFSNWTRSEIRGQTSDGLPAGALINSDGVLTGMPLHNCETPAVWLSPSLLTIEALQPSTALIYVGTEVRNGISVDHITMSQVSGTLNEDSAATLSTLSRADLYLDASSHLPVEFVFNTHPDADLSTDINVDVLFGEYQAVQGILVPFHIQRVIQGNLNLDLTVTSALVNTGIPDSDFAVQ